MAATAALASQFLESKQAEDIRSKWNEVNIILKISKEAFSIHF